MRNILRTTFALVLLAAVSLGSLRAMPAFARKYGMTCKTCHAPFPRLKPYGAAQGFDGELYFRIAAIYAPLAREALKAQRPVAIAYMNKFNDAILHALKNNPNHPGARKLLEEMGGSIR